MLITLEKTLLAQLTQDESTWFTDVLLTIENSVDVTNDLLNASAIAEQKICSTLSIPDEQYIHIENTEIVRILLIHKSIENIALHGNENSLEQNKLLVHYYRSGDESEKCALLKGLTLVDKNGCFVVTATNIINANNINQFKALSLYNSYPADFFEDDIFNQMVLKLLSMGLNISFINKLDERLNEQLSNMCFAYVIEQALAKKSPPSSIWLALKYSELTSEHTSDFNHYLNYFYQREEDHKNIINSLIKLDILPFTAVN